jgi:hypothetical protein
MTLALMSCKEKTSIQITDILPSSISKVNNTKQVAPLQWPASWFNKDLNVVFMQSIGRGC